MAGRYIVHSKTFQEKCDANEYSYALCREHSRHVKEWKIMNVNSKEYQENVVGGYYVWDVVNSECVIQHPVIFRSA